MSVDDFTIKKRISDVERLAQHPPHTGISADHLNEILGPFAEDSYVPHDLLKTTTDTGKDFQKIITDIQQYQYNIANGKRKKR